MVHLTRHAIVAVASLPGRRSVRSAGLALLLLAFTVLPAVAGNGPTDLVAASVSPTTGTTATKITFAVTFRSAKGTEPDYVRVVIGSRARAMQKTAGTESWKNGVRYTLTTKLPAGKWTVRFEAADGQFTDSIAGPTVTITKAPKPTPESTSTPRPRATPRPAAAATPRPTPAPTATPALETPSPSPDLVTAGLLPGKGGTPAGGSGGTGGSGGPDGTLPGGLGGSSSLAATIARVLPTVVVTTGGVTMLMAFLAFGKRRRDGEPTGPDDILGASAARGLGMPGHSGLVPATVPVAASAAPAAVQALAGLPMPDVDAHLPRWRRPSLMEARKNDPLRNVSTSVRLTFDGEVGDAVSGLERRLIRYRLVSLLDAPDEVRSMEIGVLDEGDEVILLEKHGTYWRVLCPDGRQGWLHKMTLGDVVIEAGAAGSTTWTSGDDGPASGNFEDMLRAYTERRQQFGGAS